MTAFAALSLVIVTINVFCEPRACRWVEEITVINMAKLKNTNKLFFMVPPSVSKPSAVLFIPSRQRLTLAFWQAFTKSVSIIAHDNHSTLDCYSVRGVTFRFLADRTPVVTHQQQRIRSRWEYCGDP